MLVVGCCWLADEHFVHQFEIEFAADSCVIQKRMVVNDCADERANMAEAESHVGMGVLHNLRGDASGTGRLVAVAVVVAVDVVGFHCRSY